MKMSGSVALLHTVLMNFLNSSSHHGPLLVTAELIRLCGLTRPPEY